MQARGMRRKTSGQRLAGGWRMAKTAARQHESAAKRRKAACNLY